MDDGKRFCDGRCGGVCFFNEKGGGLEEGGLEIAPGRRLADDGKRFSSDGRCIGRAGGRILDHFHDIHIYLYLSLVGGESEGGRVISDWSSPEAGG